MGSMTKALAEGRRSPSISLRLLGRPRIVVDGEDLTARIKYRRGFALLGYLAAHAGIWHTREKLADLLWPGLDSHAARSNLRQVLSNLTAVFGEAQCLRREGGAISLAALADLDMDLELLSDATLARLIGNDASARAWRIDAVEPLVDSLGGPFLEGLALPDAPEFEDWLTSSRAFFQRKTVLFFERLCQAQHDDGQLESAVSTARRLFLLDPVHEAHAIVLAASLAELGDHSGALDVLDSLEEALRAELDLAPSAEIVRLREDIRRLPGRPVRELAPPAPEMRWLTAMYCDIELKQDDPAAEDPAFIPALGASVAARGGRVMSAAGRGLLAIFGLDEGVERSAERALLAAIDIRKQVGRGRCPRIGIATGQTLCRFEPSSPHLMGDLPDVAMRMGWTAEPGEILVEETVALRVGERFRFAEAGDRTFRGISGVHRLFSLLPATEAAAPFPAWPSPFVGRRAETAALRQLWADACAGRPRVALVRGAAGLGKTRLGVELSRWIEAQGGQVRRIPCRLEIQHRPLAPILDSIAQYTVAPGDRETTNRRKQFIAYMQAQYPDFEPHHEAVLSSLLEGSPCCGDGALPNKDAAFSAILALISRRIGLTPTLILVDDLHWADHATHELIALFARSLQNQRALLVVTMRPEAALALPEGTASLFDLEPLSPAESHTLLAAANTAGTIPAAECERIALAGGGVPLFIEHLTRSWLEGSHHLLPIHEVLQAELDGLGPDKTVLRTAAVLGAQFPESDLRRLAPKQDVARALAKALACGLITRITPATYAFRHALIRDAAYEGLPYGSRKALHEAAAQHLEAKPDCSPEDIARHLSAAQNWAAAAPWWLKAGELAATGGYAAHAMACYQQAIDALTHAGADARDNALQDARIRLGFAIQMAQGYGSERAYREFSAVADQIHADDAGESRRETLFLALSGLFMGSSSQGVVEGLRTARRLQTLARTPAESLMASFALGNTLFWAGEFQEALSWQRQGIALASGVAAAERGRYCVDDPVVTCRAFASWTLWFRGDPQAAVEMAAEAVALARREQHVHALCFALVFAAGVHWFCEDAQQVATFAGEGLELSRRYAFPLWEGASGLFLACALASSGKSSDTSTVFGAATLLSRSYQAGITTSRWITARALIALDAWREAEELLEISVREAHLHEDQYCLPDLLWLQGECLARDNRLHEAVDHFSRARDLARAQGAAGLLARFDAAEQIGRREARHALSSRKAS
ncbi:MAG: AAA family ATPase [Betaproteobacteria bacterium]|nr:AAA family ATPase [Betaproteobacteria bacterium]